jgi:hypothetical protein
MTDVTKLELPVRGGDMEKTCSICGTRYVGWGNNARPINTGRCCDTCNQIVIGARIARIRDDLPMQVTFEELHDTRPGVNRT